MLNILRADLYKMFKSSALKILFIISTLCACAMAVIAYGITFGKISGSASGIGFLFSDVNVISLIGSACAGIFICSDFDCKNIQNAISSGISRTAIILGKTLSFFITLILFLLPYAVVIFICIIKETVLNMNSVGVGFLHIASTGSLTSVSFDIIIKLIGICLTLILVYMAQLSICIPLCFFTKKPVAVIVIYYAITLVCAQLLAVSLNYNSFDKLFSLTPFGGKNTFLNLQSNITDIGKAIAVSTIFIIIILGITIAFFKKSEIK